jgi:hypothetical protein
MLCVFIVPFHGFSVLLLIISSTIWIFLLSIDIDICAFQSSVRVLFCVHRAACGHNNRRAD